MGFGGVWLGLHNFNEVIVEQIADNSIQDLVVIDPLDPTRVINLGHEVPQQVQFRVQVAVIRLQ